VFFSKRSTEIYRRTKCPLSGFSVKSLPESSYPFSWLPPPRKPFLPRCVKTFIPPRPEPPIVDYNFFDSARRTFPLSGFSSLAGLPLPFMTPRILDYRAPSPFPASSLDPFSAGQSQYFASFQPPHLFTDAFFFFSGPFLSILARPAPSRGSLPCCEELHYQAPRRDLSLSLFLPFARDLALFGRN